MAYHASMKVVVRILAMFVLCLSGAGGVQADPGPEVLSDAAAQEWRHVGRLNISGKRFCTATLISERVVVTAAHCVFDPDTKAAVPLSGMHFVAGLNRGAHAAARRIARVALLPEYRFDGRVDHDRVVADVAVLQLAEPIPASEVIPAERHARTPVGTMALVSYSRSRPHAPSLERGSGMLWREGRLMVLAFDVTYGASGSPVFVEVGGRHRLVGIVSASATVNGRRVALSVMTDDLLDRLLKQLSPVS